MSNTEQLIDQFFDCGGWLRASGERVDFNSPNKNTESLLPELKANKAQVIQILTANPRTRTFGLQVDGKGISAILPAPLTTEQATQLFKQRFGGYRVTDIEPRQTT